MKQLARTAVYWPNNDQDIAALCHKCTTSAIHQNAPPKAALRPWMLPEKPRSRLHLDHAINFVGHNWLVMVDAYSKYLCIHPTQSISAKTTMNLLEQDFALFGYPHTLVTDNAPTFMSDEFQDYCQARGIVHLTGAPYHPATNGAAERLVQTFKQSPQVRQSTKRCGFRVLDTIPANTYGKWVFTEQTPVRSSNSHEVRSSTNLSCSPLPREAGTDCHQGAFK